MIDKWEQGYDVVYGVRERREGEGWFKLMSAKFFYRILRRLTSVEIPVDVGDFRLIDRRVVREFRALRERSRFVRGMISWLGFKQGEVRYARQRRQAGETKYPLHKMLHFAVDGILSFSQAPLKLASGLGLISSSVSFVFILYGLVQKFLNPKRCCPVGVRCSRRYFSSVACNSSAWASWASTSGGSTRRSSSGPLYVVDDEVNFDS